MAAPYTNRKVLFDRPDSSPSSGNALPLESFGQHVPFLLTISSKKKGQLSNNAFSKGPKSYLHETRYFAEFFLAVHGEDFCNLLSMNSELGL
jgi:hypothetical protein